MLTFEETFFHQLWTQKNKIKKSSKNSKPTVSGVHGKVPPQALEIEEAVLGALMLEKDAFSMVSDFLHPEDFYKPQHIKIFKAICDLENHSHR